MKLEEAKEYLNQNGYIVEGAKTDDEDDDLNIKQDKVRWNIFRKKANKILANFMATIVEDIVEQMANELDQSIDDVWEFYEGGKESFIKDAISDENDELLNIVGELWNTANKCNQIYMK